MAGPIQKDAKIDLAGIEMEVKLIGICKCRRHFVDPQSSELQIVPLNLPVNSNVPRQSSFFVESYEFEAFIPRMINQQEMLSKCCFIIDICLLWGSHINQFSPNGHDFFLAKTFVSSLREACLILNSLLLKPPASHHHYRLKQMHMKVMTEANQSRRYGSP
ncbi:hypothetical protein ACTXT7_006338 [Hymenolepis weldensis]